MLMTSNRRRFAAVAAQHPLLATLRLVVMALLPLWIGYFFAVTLFEKDLNAVTLPAFGAPLGAVMVIPASAVAFVITVIMVGRALAFKARKA